jgi:hypothetical protein
MAPKPPKAQRRSPDSTEHPPNAVGLNDDQQTSSAPSDDAGGQSNSGYQEGEPSCSDVVCDTEDDPWRALDENPIDPVSSHR